MCGSEIQKDGTENFICLPSAVHGTAWHVEVVVGYSMSKGWLVEFVECVFSDFSFFFFFKAYDLLPSCKTPL